VSGRNPRLGQLAAQQQPELEVAIGVVSLRPALAAALGGRLGRVGQVSGVAGPLDLLADEPPAGRPLEREVGLETLEARSRTDSRSPGLMRPRFTSPVSVSSVFVVIWLR
jgi:hypothetical protein